ncbi:hypothetical protein Hrubri_4361 [Herbaspirillum rubrisubalbicans M1]|nr:hypothetical protein Hrubri_4361 [Herbaspirillum rubrisubalbicans M1]
MAPRAVTHPLMKRFHNPDDEKRSLEIVPQLEYEAWLNVKDPEVARLMLSINPAELKAWPAQRPKAGPKTKPAVRKVASQNDESLAKTSSLY